MYLQYVSAIIISMTNFDAIPSEIGFEFGSGGATCRENT
jgi:hypothetical protein